MKNKFRNNTRDEIYSLIIKSREGMRIKEIQNSLEKEVPLGIINNTLRNLIKSKSIVKENDIYKINTHKG
jgi:predicted transcriptional regulator